MLEFDNGETAMVYDYVTNNEPNFCKACQPCMSETYYHDECKYSDREASRKSVTWSELMEE
jgi:hypothetical protein